MRIDHLHLKGVTCFSGDVTLDFTQIPPGLVAIVGPNGAGKTSLMESMVAAVYRQMPTRGPVLDYATGKDSYVDVGVTFDQAGAFRARLNLDGVKGASDAVLERVTNGLAQRLNDGKVSTFDAAVKDIFPPLDALLASAFAAQNRMGSFATRNKTERKDLFYTLLGLHQLDGYATTARAIVNVLEKRLAETRGRRDALKEHASDELLAQLQQQADALTIDLTAAAREVRSLTDLLANYETVVLAPYRADVQRLAALITDRARFEASQAEQQRQRHAAAADVAAVDVDEARESGTASTRTEATIRQHDAQLAALVSDDQIFADDREAQQRITDALETFQTTTQARIHKNRGLKDRSTEIRAAAAAVSSAQARLNAVQGLLDQRSTEEEAARTRAAAAEQEQRDVDTLIAEQNRVGHTANLLLNVPCSGEGQYAGCQFLKDATGAAARFRELTAMHLHERRDRALDAVRDADAAFVASRQALEATRTEIASLTSSLESNRADANLLPFLEAAELRIAELQQAIADAETQAGSDLADVDHRTDERVAARNRERARLTEAIAEARVGGDAELEEIRHRNGQRRQQCVARRDQLDETLASLEAQLAATADTVTEHAQAELALAAAVRRQGEQQQLLNDAGITHARLEEQVILVRRRQEECEQRRSDVARLQGAITTDENDLIEWQALAQAMGRDGLPVLEIDAAGPGVSAEANDLLQASFGGRFLVELVTQEPKADGKGLKEVFELKVYDHERGGEERDLSDLSGGEQVVVDEALKSAIALFVNRRNDRPIRTVWRDETTGALDPDNAQRYVAMLRRLHERAGLHHLIFVSHNPDVSAQADAQLQVADGRVTIAYPPFAPAPASQEAA